MEGAVLNHGSVENCGNFWSPEFKFLGYCESQRRFLPTNSFCINIFVTKSTDMHQGRFHACQHLYFNPGDVRINAISCSIELSAILR